VLKGFWGRNTLEHNLCPPWECGREAAALSGSHSELERLYSADREKGLRFHWES